MQKVTGKRRIQHDSFGNFNVKKFKENATELGKQFSSFSCEQNKIVWFHRSNQTKGWRHLEDAYRLEILQKYAAKIVRIEKSSGLANINIIQRSKKHQYSSIISNHPGRNFEKKNQNGVWYIIWFSAWRQLKLF